MNKQSENNREETVVTSVQTRDENKTSVRHKISFRACPEIQELLEKSRRWREDINYRWA